MALTPDNHAQQGLAQTSPAVKLMLTNELMTCLDQLVDAADPTIFHQLQGRARLLRELLNLIERAEHGPLRHPAHQTANTAVR